MSINEHLAVGEKLAGHYEVLHVLGEDTFEIVYLVKDLHMGDEKFVLKELFLSEYASRGEQNHVDIPAKAKQSFEQTKQDIMQEVQTLREQKLHSPQYYGYFEENNTLYTIMEFINTSNLSAYLNTQSDSSQEEIGTKVTQENTQATPSTPKETKEKPKSKFFLYVLLISLLIFLGLLYYSYNMIEEDKLRAKNRSNEPVNQVEPTVMKHPPLADKTQTTETPMMETEDKVKPQETQSEENVSNTTPEINENTILDGASYIDEENLTEGMLATQETISQETPTETAQDLSHLPIAETFPMEETSTSPTPSSPPMPKPPAFPELETRETAPATPPETPKPYNPLGTRVN